MNGKIIGQTEKTLILEKSFDDFIACKDKISTLKNLYKQLGSRFPVYSIANYRDGLVHYDKLFSSLDEVEIACQKYALDEHLQRCIKDACVLLAHIFLYVTNPLLSGKYKGCHTAYTALYDEIFAEAPVLKDNIRGWTYNNLSRICEELWKNDTLKCLKFPAKDKYTHDIYVTYLKHCLYIYFFDYIAETVSDNVKNDLRVHVHNLTNHILDMRSNSTELIRGYQGKENAFDDFIKIADDIYNFLGKNFLLGPLYLLSN